MKHITEEYGQPTNLMECTFQEYRAIAAMLQEVGVETRMVSRKGDQVKFQIRNTINWAASFHKDYPKIKEMAEDQIQEGTWRR